jgi:hypothetical protein
MLPALGTRFKTRNNCGCTVDDARIQFDSGGGADDRAKFKVRIIAAVPGELVTTLS